MSTRPLDTTGCADIDTSTTNGGRAAMSRLRFDPMALIAGLVFTGIATAYLLRAAGAVSVSPQWSLAVAAIGLGLAGLAGALWAMVPGSRGVRGTGAARPPTPPPRAVWPRRSRPSRRVRSRGRPRGTGERPGTSPNRR